MPGSSSSGRGSRRKRRSPFEPAKTIGRQDRPQGRCAEPTQILGMKGQQLPGRQDSKKSLLSKPSVLVLQTQSSENRAAFWLPIT
jgi:hypothetical protein